MWKRYSSYEGGTAEPADRVVACSPTRGREIRRLYVHAIDVVPTLLQRLAIELPETVKGHTQHPIEV